MVQIQVRLFASHPLAADLYREILSTACCIVLDGEAYQVAVFDSTFPGIDTALAEARQECPGARAIVVAESVADHECLAWARRGFWGVVGYDRCQEHLPAAVQQIASGQMYVPAAVAWRLMLDREGFLRDAAGPVLTEREREAFQLIAGGLCYKDIGTILHISERTVKFHVANIFKKLHVRSRREIEHRRMARAS